MTGKTDWTQLEPLFAAYLSGDAEATRRLFSDLKHRLGGYFRTRIGSDADAEDLLQVTLLKIHFARDRYDATRSLKTWVFAIASRTLIDHWRGESGKADREAEGSAGLEELPSELLTPEEKMRLHRDLNRALQALKPIDRSIVYLYGVEGFSMAEIAELLSLSEGATKLRAHRAYAELRKLLGWGIILLIGAAPSG